MAIAVSLFSVSKDAFRDLFFIYRYLKSKEVYQMLIPKHFSSVIRRRKQMKDTQNPAFDINNPEKEFNEYKDAAERLVKEREAQVKLSEALKADSERYNQLSLELSHMVDRWDIKDINGLLEQISESLKSIETKQLRLTEMDKDIKALNEAMEKEKGEAEQAADYAAEKGHTSYQKKYEAYNKDKTIELAALEKTYDRNMKDINKLISEADKRIQSSISKIESKTQSLAGQSKSVINAMADPNGAGGLQVVEAAGTAMMLTTTGAFELIKGIKASMQKHDFKALQEKIDGIFTNISQNSNPLENEEKDVEGLEL